MEANAAVSETLEEQRSKRMEEIAYYEEEERTILRKTYHFCLQKKLFHFMVV